MRILFCNALSSWIYDNLCAFHMLTLFELVYIFMTGGVGETLKSFKVFVTVCMNSTLGSEPFTSFPISKKALATLP